MGVLARNSGENDPLLENLANNLSPGGRRRLRYRRQKVLWRVTDLQRLAYCGRVIQSNGNGVQLRHREGVAGWHGLQHCGSVWSCPHCSARIRVHRAMEIGAVLGAAVAEGLSLAFCTFTMRHNSGQTLVDLWGAAQKAWQRVVSGAHWQKAKGLGVLGSVRVWEVTYGRNGWHVHVHMVLVLEPAAAGQLDTIASGMFDRWSRGLVASGLDAPLRVGQDWHLVDGEGASEHLGEYLAKMADDAPDPDGLGLELTHGLPGKSARHLSTSTTWAILDHIELTGEARAFHLWREWERVSKGKRQIGWSKGLRERFAPGVDELSDEAIAQTEVGSSADDVLHLDAAGWYELVRLPDRIVMLLEIVEAGGVRTATQALDRWKIEYTTTRRDHDGQEGNGQDRPAGSGGEHRQETAEASGSGPRGSGHPLGCAAVGD